MQRGKKYSIDSEIIDYIERYLDKDVNLILENKPLDLAKRVCRNLTSLRRTTIFMHG
ncbi:hypothetical protein JCM10003_538 [Bacteroides pyogenes JCM 10003]|nr:hypothetical protein JCM10003_538 [Bacteroides pyogenes JCM 10003]